MNRLFIFPTMEKMEYRALTKYLRLKRKTNNENQTELAEVYADPVPWLLATIVINDRSVTVRLIAETVDHSFVPIKNIFGYDRSFRKMVVVIALN